MTKEKGVFLMILCIILNPMMELYNTIFVFLLRAGKWAQMLQLLIH